MPWFDLRAAARFDLSGGREMQDEGRGDAGRNGEDSAPPPVWENAEGNYHQDSQCGEFD